MFRFKGGQTVGKGTYWNLSNGEGIDMDGKRPLPGGGSVKYLRLPSGGMFVLGPFLGLLFVCLLPLMSLVIALTLLSRVALASDALSSEEAGKCLSCHSSEGMVKTFKNNENVSIHIAKKHFKDTVHGFLSCTDCHADVSLDSHPSAQYKSIRDFAASISRSCRNCHTDDQILAKPMHNQAVSRANAPPCSDCHGSHSIRKSSELKQNASNSQYCLSCHQKQFSVTINGEKVSLSVNEEVLRQSVHSNHDCTDCHSAFSKEAHPVEKFGSRRELSISISGACKGCHQDKHKQLEGSIHFSMLKEGNLKAPVCTDCHGFHNVGRKAILETVAGVPCKKCHENIFEDYKESVHGVAKMSGKNAAPVCSSCHFAHEVKPALISRSPGETCLGCHKKAVDIHSEWLPNAAIHLEAVACTACHVPNAGMRVYLNATDSASGLTASASKVKELLGAGHTALTGRDGIGDRQMWDIYQALTGKGAGMSIQTTLGLRDSGESHHLASKGKAVRQCDNCHNANSEFFKSVAMTVVDNNGREEFYAVKPQVLSSIFALLPLNQFYVMGGTRVKLLDFLGVFMVIAGASFPAAHIMIRILTRRLRSSSKHTGRH
ncbi:MAG: cytochrome c3 family protein [Thermodesulfovibrionales bacterium]|nr:cytochrome c3 family protein [Thermodesulfovibrionales bacterium]